MSLLTPSAIHFYTKLSFAIIFIINLIIIKILNTFLIDYSLMIAQKRIANELKNIN
jgi:hypothetical protein